MQDRTQRERIWREAVLAGDSLAWEVGYQQAYAPLAKYIHWRCAGLNDLREEVLQETWLTAVKSIRKFDPLAGSFIDWLCGIAGNLIRNHLKKRQRRGITQSLNSDVPSRNGQPDLEKSERIALALSGLPERYEKVLRAKYVEQLTVQSISETWGESPKTIESLLSRAREAFREAYGSEE